MSKLGTTFLTSAVLGALAAAAIPTHAAPSGFVRSIHGHACEVGTGGMTSLGKNRIASVGGIGLSCPVPEDTTARAFEAKGITADVYNPGLSAQVMMQACQTYKNADNCGCSGKVYTSSTASGQTTLTLGGSSTSRPFPSPYLSPAYYPMVYFEVPDRGALNGFTVIWP